MPGQRRRLPAKLRLKPTRSRDPARRFSRRAAKAPRRAIDGRSPGEPRCRGAVDWAYKIHTRFGPGLLESDYEAVAHLARPVPAEPGRRVGFAGRHRKPVPRARRPVHRRSRSRPSVPWGRAPPGPGRGRGPAGPAPGCPARRSGTGRRPPGSGRGRAPGAQGGSSANLLPRLVGFEETPGVEVLDPRAEESRPLLGREIGVEER